MNTQAPELLLSEIREFEAKYARPFTAKELTRYLETRHTRINWMFGSRPTGTHSNCGLIRNLLIALRKTGKLVAYRHGNSIMRWELPK